MLHNKKLFLLVLVTSLRGRLVASSPRSTYGHGRGCSPEVPGRPLGWFHVPKTSTGFGASVALANCNISDKACHEGPAYWHATCNQSGTQQSGMWLTKPEDWHPPLNAGMLAVWSGRLVGMLRSPAEWKRSFFQDKLLNSYKYLPTPESNKTRSDWQDHLAALGADLNASWALLEGNQAGYLLGIAPTSRATKNAKVLRKAMAILEDQFAFVGLTHRYELSICLFNTMFGLGRCTPCQLFHANSGESKVEKGKELEAWVPEELMRRPDPVDDALIAFVEALLETRLRQHGLTPARCATLGCGSV